MAAATGTAAAATAATASVAATSCNHGTVILRDDGPYSFPEFYSSSVLKFHILLISDLVHI